MSGPISSSSTGSADQADVIVPPTGAGAGDTCAVAAADILSYPAPADTLAGPDRNGDAAGGMASIKRRAVRSSLWTMGAFGFGQALRVFTSPILAYLLTPQDFGIVGLITVFVTGLSALSDVGIEQAVIQNKRGDDPDFLNTAWTLHVIRGVLLWIGCCLIAYPVYWLYQDKANARVLVMMFPVAGIASLLNGFNSTRVFSLNRHLDMGRITILSLGHQVIAVAVQIAIAWRWPTPWSIILGGLAANAYVMVASHTILPGIRNRFHWDREIGRELMRFGRWIMVSTLITYTAMQIDRPLMAKLLDEAWLGLYVLALNLVRVPVDVVGRLASVTLFPALARAAEQQPADLRRVFLRARALILIVSIALTVGVVLGGPLFIKLFFRTPWHQAGWLARWATIGAWITLLQATADRALLALGKTRPLATSNAVNLAVTVVGALLGQHIDAHVLGHPGGIVGFMLGMCAGKLAGHLMIQIAMARVGLPVFRQDLHYSAILLVASLLGIFLPEILNRSAERVFLFDGVVAVTVCGLTCAWAGIKVLRAIR
ncbi:MAG TPA: oligosaccharide flippase family protein [Tepidisphaeraceae bacterium]